MGILPESLYLAFSLEKKNKLSIFICKKNNEIEDNNILSPFPHHQLAHFQPAERRRIHQAYIIIGDLYHPGECIFQCYGFNRITLLYL